MESSSHDRWKEDSAVGNGGGMEMEGTELCCHRNPFILQAPGHRPYPHLRDITPPSPTGLLCPAVQRTSQGGASVGALAARPSGAPTQTPV